VKVAGINIKNYKDKNPVILWAHNYSQPPIAKATKVTKSKDGTLKIRAQFPEMEEYGFADTIYKLLKGGYLNAVSIGFMPADVEDAVEHVDPKKNKGARRIFHKTELLEVSVVPVPANPEALLQTRGIQKALEDKVVDEGELKELEMYFVEEKYEAVGIIPIENPHDSVVPHDELTQKITETIIEEVEEPIKELENVVDEIEEQVEGLKEDMDKREEKVEEDESYMQLLLEAAREHKASRERAEKEQREILDALKKLNG
jgi:HK97 family phage prohead protease